MRRPGLLLLALVLAAPSGCLLPSDDEESPDARADADVAAIAQKARLQDDLTRLAGGECEVDVREELVNVRLTPGPGGLPDAAVLRRMSRRITELTGTAPEQQVIVATSGRALFVNGAVCP